MLEEPSNMERATIKERFYALLIDYAVFGVTFLVLIFVMPRLFFPMTDKTTLILIILNFLFFLKDSTGLSLGKRLIKIKIVRKSDLKKPSFILPFIRNVFLCLGIIEIIAILSDENHERLGDRITKTMVIRDK